MSSQSTLTLKVVTVLTSIGASPVAGELCGRFLQGSWAAGITDDIRLLSNQNVSHDKMADDWIILVQWHNTVTKLTNTFLYYLMLWYYLLSLVSAFGQFSVADFVCYSHYVILFVLLCKQAVMSYIMLHCYTFSIVFKTLLLDFQRAVFCIFIIFFPSDMNLTEFFS